MPRLKRKRRLRLGGDSCSEFGVDALSVKIASYWRKHGYPGIRVWVTTERTKNGKLIYCIRSNIKSDGYPPNTAVAQG
jgi:hypothetical protein